MDGYSSESPRRIHSSTWVYKAPIANWSEFDADRIAWTQRRRRRHQCLLNTGYFRYRVFDTRHSVLRTGCNQSLCVRLVREHIAFVYIYCAIDNGNVSYFVKKNSKTKPKTAKQQTKRCSLSHPTYTNEFHFSIHANAQRGKFSPPSQWVRARSEHNAWQTKKVGYFCFIHFGVDVNSQTAHGHVCLPCTDTAMLTMPESRRKQNR